MNEEYGNDFVTLTDEDGTEYEFEIIRELEIDGERYAALLPVCTEEECDHNDDDDEDVYIVRIIEENGEEIFEIIEDDAEFERVSAAFEVAFEEDEDSESDDETDEEDDENK